MRGGAGNPFVDGWYADPDMKVYGSEYWVSPTYSAPYDQQTFLDAFSSRDLVTWEKHSHVLCSKVPAVDPGMNAVQDLIVPNSVETEAARPLPAALRTGHVARCRLEK